MSEAERISEFVANHAGSKNQLTACFARLLATGAYEKVAAWFNDEANRDIPTANMALIQFVGLIFGGPMFYAKPGQEIKAIEIISRQISEELQSLANHRREFRATTNK